MRLQREVATIVAPVPVDWGPAPCHGGTAGPGSLGGRREGGRGHSG